MADAVLSASEEEAEEEEDAEEVEALVSEAQELIETIIAAIRQIDANLFIVITFPFIGTHPVDCFFVCVDNFLVFILKIK